MGRTGKGATIVDRERVSGAGYRSDVLTFEDGATLDYKIYLDKRTAEFVYVHRINGIDRKTETQG